MNKPSVNTHSRLVDPGKKGTLKSEFYGTERQIKDTVCIFTAVESPAVKS